MLAACGMIIHHRLGAVFEQSERPSDVGVCGVVRLLAGLDVIPNCTVSPHSTASRR